MTELIDPSTNTFQTIATVITGGAFVGWYREHRKGKKDANDFAIKMISQLSDRVDGLVMEVAELKAANNLAAEAMRILRAENVVLTTENTRLKTALGEQNRRADQAQDSLNWHEQQGEKPSCFGFADVSCGGPSR